MLLHVRLCFTSPIGGFHANSRFTISSIEAMMRFIKPTDSAFQVNDFGRAPKDALSKVENHIFAPLHCFIIVYIIKYVSVRGKFLPGFNPLANEDILLMRFLATMYVRSYHLPVVITFS